MATAYDNWLTTQPEDPLFVYGRCPSCDCPYEDTEVLPTGENLCLECGDTFTDDEALPDLSDDYEDPEDDV
jgi:hypothetical protein